MIDPGAFRRPLLGHQVDHSHPLAAGLMECYALAEGGGPQLFDLCHRHVAARQAGTAAWAAVDHARWRGHKVVLDGSTYYQSPSHTLGFSDATGVTIECLVKPAAMASRLTLYGRNNAAGAPQLEIGNSSGSPTATAMIAGTLTAATTTQLVNGNWYHLVYTRNPATMTNPAQPFFYGHEWTINGAHLQSSSTAANVSYVDTAGPTLIGARAAASQLWNGDLAWLRVWRRYMPPADRGWLFAEPWAMAGPRPRRMVFGPAAPTGRLLLLADPAQAGGFSI